MKKLMHAILLLPGRMFVFFCLLLAGLSSTQAETAVEGSLFNLSLDELLNIVTVRKKTEKSVDVPLAVTSFPEQTLHDYDIKSFNDYATKTPNLSFSYGNGFTVGNPSTGLSNSRTFAIRGITGARANGFYLDDIALAGAVDVRVFDLKNIEILKGPQGTLFGEGSLGGNIRYISKQPDLYANTLRYRLESGQTLHADRFNFGAETVGNLVLEPGKSALRISAFNDDYAAYINRTYLSDISNTASPRSNGEQQGGQQNLGGSIAGLLQATPDFDLSARLMFQNKHLNGFNASWAPLPTFEPQYSMERRANIQSDMRDSWVLPSLSLVYRGNGWTLNSVTSEFDRNTRDLEDSTEGTLQITTGMPAQASQWISEFKSRQISHETRVSFDPDEKLSGTVGVYFSENKMDYAILPNYAQGVTPPLLWQETEFNTQRNAALFGELYYKFLNRWTLTLGDRLYWLNQSDEHTVLVSNTNTTSSGSSSSSGHSPKVGLARQLSESAMLYGSATNGYRQGNTQLDASILGCGTSLAALGTSAESLRRIKPDSIWSYEAGGKFEWPDPGLVLSAAVFHIDWQNPQQQLLLTNCGLFVQGNAGAATVDGSELELSGNLTSALKLRLGLGYEETRIAESGNTGQAVGSHIYQTPQWTATTGLVYSKRFNDTFKGLLALDYSYMGSSVSSNNGPYNLVRAAYSLLNVRGAVSWAQSELALSIKNLTDAKPNLGDITYIGYGLYTDATRTTPIPQVATLPPRTIMLQYAEHF